MKFIACEPGSDEWHRARLGIPTASQAKRILTPSKLSPSEQRDGYMHELIAERLLGTWLDDGRTDFMARGNALEAEAVKYYEFAYDSTTQPGGFCTTDDGRAGCSPDRLVNPEGGLEIKCPKPSTHAGYLVKPDALVKDYKLQVLFMLWVTGRPWWDLLSYHPEMPPALVRVPRDEPSIKLIGDRMREFCDELETLYKVALSKRGDQPHDPIDDF